MLVSQACASSSDHRQQIVTGPLGWWPRNLEGSTWVGVRVGGGAAALSDHLCSGVALRLTYGAGGSFSGPPTAGMSYRSLFPLP